MVVYIKLIAAVLLVFVNGFFVLAEFSIVKVRRTKLEELAKNGGTAKIALNISHRLDSYLSAIQLGITLASLALGWLGEPAVVTLIEPLLIRITGESNPAMLHTISVVVAFTLITLMHVVLGELVPKSVAIQKAETMALVVAWPLYIFHKLAYPIVYLFDHVAAFGLKVLGMTPGKDHEQSHSEEELRMIVSASYHDGVIDDTEGLLLDNVFTFADKKAHEIMVPRTDMVCLFLDDPYEKNKETVLSSHHTRFPLCKEDKDNVIGMVHLRDMLESKEPLKNMESIKREILFVPESLKISTVLQLMRVKRIHLSVVVDEYGGTAGLLSLEDILEEIVGDIEDEHDSENKDIIDLGNNVYELSGLFLQGDFEKLADVDLGDNDDETIGGLVFSLLGRKAEVGDIVQCGGYNFEVLSVQNLRVDKVKAYPADADSSD